MRASQQAVMFSLAALLVAAFCVAEQAQTDDTAPGGASSKRDAGIGLRDQRARIAAFLADKGGNQPHDFPAWNEYKKIVGDTSASRSVFADMLRAEPDLCAAVGGDPKWLAEQFVKRVDVLKQMVDRRSNVVVEGNTIVDYGITLSQMAAIIFVAARHDVTTRVNRDREVRDVVALPPIMQWRHFKPAEEDRSKWRSPDSRLAVIKRLMTCWAVREADPHTDNSRFSTLSRYMVAEIFVLEDAKVPLALEILRHPKDFRGSGNPFISWAVKHAFLTVVTLDKKDNRRLLGPFLRESWKLRDCINMHDRMDRNADRVDTPPEVRDLALSSVVQLSGFRPVDYGFTQFEVPAVYSQEPVQVYLFCLPRDRNRGFEKCAKHYRELGLQEPPPFAPGFTFMRSAQGSLRGSRTTPDGKTRFDLRGNSARLTDVTTGQEIGKEIHAGIGTYPHEKFVFTCCAFSADGKYVATGSRFHEAGRSVDEVPTNLGRVEVWNAATGELVDRYYKTVGGVSAVDFSPNESMIVLFVAEDASRDISKNEKTKRPRENNLGTLTVGGTSAGCDILGGWVFTAEGLNPVQNPGTTGSLTSAEAMANPYRSELVIPGTPQPTLTLETNILNLSLLSGILTESHFHERDRMGRSITFLAHLAVSCGLGTSAKTVAIDESTAVCISASGTAHVYGQGRAYFMKPTPGNLPLMDDNLLAVPLDFRHLLVNCVIPSSGNFVFANAWDVCGTTYYVSASIYGPDDEVWPEDHVFRDDMYVSLKDAYDYWLC